MQKSNIKISVIVPIYNVEKYLDISIPSILNQSFKDFEVICVDDGSKDNSYEILKQYALKDDRIKAFGLIKDFINKNKILLINNNFNKLSKISDFNKFDKFYHNNIIKFIEKIFSVRNKIIDQKKVKVITILGFEIKLKPKKKRI